MERQDIPIILTAFGTTARAFETYDRMGGIIRSAFPDNPLHWAYSSRMVKHAMKKKLDLKDPIETARELAGQGHPWVVLQSLHLICGHEFDRLVGERDHADIRSAVGLPLLTSHRDYEDTAAALAGLLPESDDQAVVLVGHGTDHPAWTAYPALEAILRKRFGKRIFVGVVEDFPDMDYTLERVRDANYRKVCLIPLMLVAGVHFREDLTGDEDSWQKTFERCGIHVTVRERGIGHVDEVTRIFCRHIAEALDVIPV